MPISRRVFILISDVKRKMFYIPEHHWALIRQRHAEGKKVLSLVYDLSREDIAKILTSSESDLVSR